MNVQVTTVLNGLVKEFEDGSRIPEALAYASFPIPHIPSASWSFVNQMIMFLSNTNDARGYRQWQEVERHVKKGAKAISILVPRFSKVELKKDEEELVLAGFMCGCVFRYEDTDGKPLEYENLTLPELPLRERAEQWGVSVKAIPGSVRLNGYYRPDTQTICLATPEEKTFFHELSHVAHEKLQGSLKIGQDPFQEIVAELSAQALCRIVGKDGAKYFGNSYRYIEDYAKRMNETPQSAVFKVIGEVEQVLKLILGKTKLPQKLASEVA